MGRLPLSRVSSSFCGAQRKALFDQLLPLVTRLRGHPWEDGFELRQDLPQRNR